MKAVAVTVCFTLVTVNVYADIKWIPIVPIHSPKNSKADSNISKPQPVNSLIEKVKGIQHLLDNKRQEPLPTENKKNWYALDTMEND